MVQLTDLPLELRQEIYRSLILDCVHERTTARRQNKKPSHDYTGLSIPACLKLSRSIMQEVEDVFYDITKFKQIGAGKGTVSEPQRLLMLKIKRMEVTASRSSQAWTSAKLSSYPLTLNSVDSHHLKTWCVNVEKMDIRLYVTVPYNKSVKSKLVGKLEEELEGLIVQVSKCTLVSEVQVEFILSSFEVEEWEVRSAYARVIAEAIAEQIKEGVTCFGDPSR